MADKEVYLGIEIPNRSPLFKLLGSIGDSVSGALGGSPAHREATAPEQQVRATDELMRSPGIESASASPWLLRHGQRRA